MERALIDQLNAWKSGPHRKPLILMGARQVGKTTLLKQFGAESYHQTVYLNFEITPALCDLFKSSLKPTDILNAISIEMNTTITPTNTLIILDEIQECPEALNSLKYFCEEANQYAIIAAGSLLGVKLSHLKGFPVGKVDFLHLYPFSFSEFLNALQEIKLKQYIETLNKLEPLPSLLHEKLLAYFKIYLFTGGMPEAVKIYCDTKDFNQVRITQQNILGAYALDFSKHAPNQDLMKINLTWRAIPTQLAKENKKFIYSLIRSGARAKEFENAVQWLTEAGLIHKVYNISTPKLPLEGYALFDFFKIYLLDVGLLGAMTNLSAKTLLHGDELFQEFQGSLMENYVTQELARNRYPLYYWTSEGKAEIDFIVQEEHKIYPIEIKSGYSRKKKSLLVYAEKYKPDLLIRCSPNNLTLDDRILNCPLYLLGELRRLLSSN